MGFFNKLLGFRWSLYVVQDGNQLAYAMHEHSVMRMLGYSIVWKSGAKRAAPRMLAVSYSVNADACFCAAISAG